MLKRVMAIVATHLTVFFAAAPGHAMEKLTVMMSGGFSMAYRQVLPEFDAAIFKAAGQRGFLFVAGDARGVLER